MQHALVYTGTRLFGARERKYQIVGTIAEPRIGAVSNGCSIAGDSKNGLRVDGDHVFFAETDRFGLPGCLLPPGEVDAEEDDGAAQNLVRREALSE